MQFFRLPFSGSRSSLGEDSASSSTPHPVGGGTFLPPPTLGAGGCAWGDGEAEIGQRQGGHNTYGGGGGCNSSSSGNSSRNNSASAAVARNELSLPPRSTSSLSFGTAAAAVVNGGQPQPNRMMPRLSLSTSSQRGLSVTCTTESPAAPHYQHRHPSGTSSGSNNCNVSYGCNQSSVTCPPRRTPSSHTPHHQNQSLVPLLPSSLAPPLPPPPRIAATPVPPPPTVSGTTNTFTSSSYFYAPTDAPVAFAVHPSIGGEGAPFLHTASDEEEERDGGSPNDGAVGMIGSAVTLIAKAISGGGSLSTAHRRPAFSASNSVLVSNAPNANANAGSHRRSHSRGAALSVSLSSSLARSHTQQFGGHSHPPQEHQHQHTPFLGGGGGLSSLFHPSHLHPSAASASGRGAVDTLVPMPLSTPHGLRAAPTPLSAAGANKRTSRGERGKGGVVPALFVSLFTCVCCGVAASVPSFSSTSLFSASDLLGNKLGEGTSPRKVSKIAKTFRKIAAVAGVIAVLLVAAEALFLALRSDDDLLDASSSSSSSTLSNNNYNNNRRRRFGAAGEEARNAAGDDDANNEDAAEEGSGGAAVGDINSFKRNDGTAFLVDFFNNDGTVAAAAASPQGTEEEKDRPPSPQKPNSAAAMNTKALFLRAPPAPQYIRVEGLTDPATVAALIFDETVGLHEHLDEDSGSHRNNKNYGDADGGDTTNSQSFGDSSLSSGTSSYDYNYGGDRDDHGNRLRKSKDGEEKDSRHVKRSPLRFPIGHVKALIDDDLDESVYAAAAEEAGVADGGGRGGKKSKKSRNRRGREEALAIDIVYTYVNPSAPSFAAAMAERRARRGIPQHEWQQRLQQQNKFSVEESEKKSGRGSSFLNPTCANATSAIASSSPLSSAQPSSTPSPSPSASLADSLRAADDTEAIVRLWQMAYQRYPSLFSSAATELSHLSKNNNHQHRHHHQNVVNEAVRRSQRNGAANSYAQQHQQQLQQEEVSAVEQTYASVLGAINKLRQRSGDSVCRGAVVSRNGQSTPLLPPSHSTRILCWGTFRILGGGRQQPQQGWCHSKSNQQPARRRCCFCWLC